MVADFTKYQDIVGGLARKIRARDINRLAVGETPILTTDGLRRSRENLRGLLDPRRVQISGYATAAQLIKRHPLAIRGKIVPMSIGYRLMNGVKIGVGLLVAFAAIWCGRLTGLPDKPGSSFRIASYNSDIVMEVWQIKNKKTRDRRFDKQVSP